MWSNTQSRHAAGYKQWAGLRNTDRTPTFSQNLKFFLITKSDGRILDILCGILQEDKMIT